MKITKQKALNIVRFGSFVALGVVVSPVFSLPVRAVLFPLFIVIAILSVRRLDTMREESNNETEGEVIINH